MARAAFLLSAVLALSLREAAGYKCLFIGHSFFQPVASRMPAVTAAVPGLDHEQTIVSRGGQNGAPEALWNDFAARSEIQRHLDGGDIELFGMTYEPTYPTTAGYELWFDYALSNNPNTTFFLASPWGDFPSTFDASGYASFLRVEGNALWNDLLAELRAKYPTSTIISAPYGLGVAELRLLFDAGLLPDISALTGNRATSLHTDMKGHAGDMILDLSPLFWLNRIYDVDLRSYGGPQGEYTTDLRAIAASVLDAYDAGNLCGNAPCSCVDNDARIAQLAESIGEPWVSGCADVVDYCAADSQEGRQVRTHCCWTCAPARANA